MVYAKGVTLTALTLFVVYWVHQSLTSTEALLLTEYNVEFFYFLAKMVFAFLVLPCTLVAKLNVYRHNLAGNTKARMNRILSFLYSFALVLIWWLDYYGQFFSY